METQINSLRLFASPASQDCISAMLRAQALFKEDPNSRWKNTDVTLFSFMLCQSDLQITNPSGQGSPVFLPLQKGPYLAFQINMLGNRKTIEGNGSATVISSRGPNKACFSYITYTIMNNCILHKWELEMAFIDPWGAIHNESRNTPVSIRYHKGLFLTKSG